MSGHSAAQAPLNVAKRPVNIRFMISNLSVNQILSFLVLDFLKMEALNAINEFLALAAARC